MMRLELGSLQRAAPGESVCGDTFDVIEHDGVILVAIADGLGHGPDAARASSLFCAHARANFGTPLVELMRGCHQALASTRGAAACLARFHLKAGEFAFVGVGNIELRAIAKDLICPVSAAGVVGSRVRQLQEFSYKISPGDLIVMYSDGLKFLPHLDEYRGLASQVVAQKLTSQHLAGNDDATCIVARILSQ